MDQTNTIPTISLKDSLSFTLGQMLPNYLRGIFTPNQTGVTFFNKVQDDQAAVELLTKLRAEYHSSYLYVRQPGQDTLLVLDPEGIRHVLDHSPDIYGPQKIKVKGMSHFQPDALTISQGEAWRDRRTFCEAVLGTDQGVHPYGDAFLAVVRAETTAAADRAGNRWQWDDFARLFPKITLQVLFGEGVVDTSLTDDLHEMMQESNRSFALGKSTYFDGFYAKVRRYLQDGGPESLAALCNQVPSTEQTKVKFQIPHWMFAMADTLAINTARALALIVAHPAAEEWVRAEMAAVDLSTAAGIGALRYLEGCIQEAMRLWPTTPILARETVREDVLGGETIPVGTQVIIFNSFNHRDRETHAFADTFSPDIWLQNPVDYHFNHLSNGTQSCPGKNLALFLARAVLATLLTGRRFTLVQPLLDGSKPLPYGYNHFELEFQLLLG